MQHNSILHRIDVSFHYLTSKQHLQPSRLAFKCYVSVIFTHHCTLRQYEGDNSLFMFIHCPLLGTQLKFKLLVHRVNLMVYWDDSRRYTMMAASWERHSVTWNLKCFRGKKSMAHFYILLRSTGGLFVCSFTVQHLKHIIPKYVLTGIVLMRLTHNYVLKITEQTFCGCI